MTVVRSVPVAATARLVGEHDTDLWRVVGAPSCSGRVSRDLDGRRPGSGPARKGGGVRNGGHFLLWRWVRGERACSATMPPPRLDLA